MNKRDLISKIEDRTHYKVAEIGNVLNAMIDAITEELSESDGEVHITGFGSFATKVRPPRIVRNPKTGEIMQSKMMHCVKYTASQSLKDKINKRKD